MVAQTGHVNKLSICYMRDGLFVRPMARRTEYMLQIISV